jgi:hypothetical protein
MALALEGLQAIDADTHRSEAGDGRTRTALTAAGPGATPAAEGAARLGGR